MRLLKKKVETKHHWFISNVRHLGNLYKFCLETLFKKKKDNTQSHTCIIDHHINPYQQSFKQKCSKRLRTSKTSRLLILRSNIVGKAHTTTLKSFLKPDK